MFYSVNRHSEVALAKCGDDWYRVMLVESFGNRNPFMWFIDFGNMNTVNIDNMRQMPAEFKYPCYSVLAEIGGKLNDFYFVTALI